ncbi:transcription factor RFX4-like, partial [Oppia nitens]|uniref:transcription factor RFX4-like n=1 Tax=Oppia nitens TaxID=1686743 RepID=UPI0023DBB373
MRYQSNGYTSNGCLSHQTNQFYNSSMAPLMTTINGGANGSATACTTPTTTTTASSASTIGCPQPTTRILRPHSTPATLIWLEDNYELAEGVCIPRSVLYMHYVDFCGNNNVQPVNAASFGKIIRQQFPQLTTRRLGTRGQSRYHYYGIAIRETSVYYQSSYSKKSGQNNVDPLKREARENINKQSIPTTISSRSRTATMLPQFPNLKDVILHSSLDKDKISTFLMMYRTHCQRILDTVIRANFDEVQTFLLHFWQGVPPHLSPILECNSVINLIGVCDSILYKTIANVLLPSVLQTLPESLTKMMKQFASELDSWLRMSLYNLPETLRSVKLELARRFGQVLRRQTSLNHLSQALRMVVNNTDITLQMLRDWRTIDVQNICANIFADYFNIENNTTVDNGDNNDVMDDNDTNCNDDDTCASGVGADDNNSNTRINTNNSNRSCNSKIKLISKFCEQFEHLLEEEAQIENYLEWLESIVHKCVLYPSLKCTNTSTLRRYSRHFLLLWSAFGSRVIQDMTLQSAQSFGSFHLLRLMFDDYVLYLVEYVQLDEQMKQFLR